MIRVTDEERRARLAIRHGIAPSRRHPDLMTATRAMTAWHATEAYSVHLAITARVDDVTPLMVESALFDDHAVVKQWAMRHTLFAFAPELIPAVWGSAAARTAGVARRMLLKAVVESGLASDGEEWWVETSSIALAELERQGPITPDQAATLHPVLAQRYTVGSGASKVDVTLGPKVFQVLGAEGRVMRHSNTAHWRLARARWALTSQVVPEAGEALSSHDGYVALLRSWLWSFGPGTETDMVWWLGSTKGAVRAALAEIGAEEVALESGEVGYLLPNDPLLAGETSLHERTQTEPWAALLPVLDPTMMGWKERDFFLDPEDAGELFDRNGNAGSTAWWDGRPVGCWVQDEAGSVQVHLLERHREAVGEAGRAALEIEATRLTRLLDGTVIRPLYKSPAMKRAVAT